MAFVADSQPAEVVQVGETAFDDPALAAEAGTVRDAAPGDDGLDAPGPEQPPVLLEVIAAVGEQPVGLLTRPTDLAGHRPRREVVEQWDQLGDVVAVAARERDGQRDPGAVDQKVVL